MSKHTPGPWRVDPDYRSEIQSQPGKHIATMRPVPFAADGEFEANGNLVAAAPELLAELKRARTGYANLIEFGALPHGKWDKSAREYIASMDAVIAKAEPQGTA